MNRLNWMVARCTERVSLIGGLSLLVLVALVWVSIALLLPAQQQLTELQSMHASSSSNVLEVRPTKPNSSMFLEDIPDVNDVSSMVDSLYTLTEQHGLVLNSVTYKDELKLGEPVMRYALHFALNGDYPTIQQFLAELLMAQPYLALQNISFERAAANQSDISVQFKMSLFLNHE